MPLNNLITKESQLLIDLIKRIRGAPIDKVYIEFIIQDILANKQVKAEWSALSNIIYSHNILSFFKNSGILRSLNKTYLYIDFIVFIAKITKSTSYMPEFNSHLKFADFDPKVWYLWLVNRIYNNVIIKFSESIPDNSFVSSIDKESEIILMEESDELLYHNYNCIGLYFKYINFAVELYDGHSHALKNLYRLDIILYRLNLKMDYNDITSMVSQIEKIIIINLINKCRDFRYFYTDCMIITELTTKLMSMQENHEIVDNELKNQKYYKFSKRENALLDNLTAKAKEKDLAYVETTSLLSMLHKYRRSTTELISIYPIRRDIIYFTTATVIMNIFDIDNTEENVKKFILFMQEMLGVKNMNKSTLIKWDDVKKLIEKSDKIISKDLKVTLLYIILHTNMLYSIYEKKIKVFKDYRVIHSDGKDVTVVNKKDGTTPVLIDIDNLKI